VSQVPAFHEISQGSDSWKASATVGRNGNRIIHVTGCLALANESSATLLRRSPPSINPSILELDLLTRRGDSEPEGPPSDQHVSFDVSGEGVDVYRQVVIFYGGYPAITIECEGVDG
jgi:hypothetical protein